MRIPIRVQLWSLILLSSLIGLAVISIAVWITTHNFVLNLRASRLSLIASLKVAQLQSNLDVMKTSANFVSTRFLIQQALMRYNDDGNNTDDNWQEARDDLAMAIGGTGSIGQQLLLQSRTYGKNGTGTGGSGPLLSSTASIVGSTVELPYLYPNGTHIRLGASDPAAGPFGYPPPLYPNLTFFEIGNVSRARTPGGRVLSSESTLLLGPWMVNDTFSLVSLTIAIVNNTNPGDILGWLTTAMDARLIQDVVNSRDGLDKTGETLLLGPADASNNFPAGSQGASNSSTADFQLRFVVPLNNTFKARHPDHVVSSANSVFNATSYPVVYKAITTAEKDYTDTSGANLLAKNEAGNPVSVGYALTTSDIVQWTILVEMARPEVWQPINKLRNVILACLFSTVGLMAILALPLSHFTCLPILRLREATARSMHPPNSNGRRSLDSLGSFRDGALDGEQDEALAKKEGFCNPLKGGFKSWWRKNDASSSERREERRKRAFRIPGKVKERKYWIKDELSELTMTFNEMSDELMLQYSRLEERVQHRTAELELSKKAAEAANESKTLFIANISHELKTPLNGILGMCAVCMQEDDPLRLKRSLGIIYKSGDLLLNLLTDLLTFSKNQVGQSLSLDEKDFRLRDISSQVLAIFDKQAKDSAIDLRVQFEGVSNLTNEKVSPEPNNQGPAGTGRLKDMVLWGDVYRILQVVINLVSNSLKFTPRGGSVVLTIRCLPEIPEIASRKTSLNSRRQASRHRASDVTLSTTRLNTANAINIKDKPHALAYVSGSERTVSPPPGKHLYFEFSVQDTGPGIPENLQTKIFEPFVQGDLGLSKRFGGTGLGLSICSQLANLMRGSIAVKSTVGLGSTFAMKIPLRCIRSRADSNASSAVPDRTDGSSRNSSIDEGERKLVPGSIEYDQKTAATVATNEAQPSPPAPTVNEHVTNDSQPRLVGLSQPFFASESLESPGSQTAAMKKIAAEATRGGKIRVLVAEDNKVNQEVVLRMLKLEDIYDVTVAKDGQEALDLVRESMQQSTPKNKPFNLIFMDVQMPNVDGLTSTKMIREIGYQAPIVALTAFAEESNIKDCYDSGMNYFLSKPIRRPQLKKVLKEYCAPIPEENEETGTAEAIEESRGSGVNTTIVMVQGQGKSPVQSTAKTLVDGDGTDSRSVSPRGGV